MKFRIDGNHLVIRINGGIHIFQNDDAGYREMAAEWFRWRHR